MERDLVPCPGPTFNGLLVIRVDIVAQSSGAMVGAESAAGGPKGATSQKILLSVDKVYPPALAVMAVWENSKISTAR